MTEIDRIQDARKVINLIRGKKKMETNNKHSMVESVFSVPEITCSGCAGSITRALSRIDSISNVNVDIADKVVSVLHKPELDTGIVAQALENAGFTATKIS
jgi:copper chaperone